MIEVLLHANGVVLLIGPAPQAVRLSVVIEKIHFLAQPPQRQEELDALIPRHRIVAVVLQNQHRSLHAIGPENRRVLDETRGVLPDRPANAALRALILELPRDARAPADPDRK